MMSQRVVSHVRRGACANTAMPAQARDPIPQFRDFVLKQSILSEAQIKDIDKEVEAVVDEAVKFADESPKPVSRPFPLADRADPLCHGAK